jgi:hypothetical protein
MNILNILVGLILLLFGRRMFWFFIGVLGFLWGMNLATQYLAGETTWVVIVVGLIAGVLGAVLAVLFQRIAVAIAGFLAGSYLAISLLGTLGVDLAQFSWIVSIIGGIIGAVLVFILFDWALILLSSLVGASLVTPELTGDPTGQAVIFIALAVVGFIVQAAMMQRGYLGTRPATRRRRV